MHVPHFQQRETAYLTAPALSASGKTRIWGKPHSGQYCEKPGSMMLTPEHPHARRSGVCCFSHILPPTNLFSEIRRTKRQYPYNQVVQYCIHVSSLRARILCKCVPALYPPAKGSHQHNYPTSALLLIGLHSHHSLLWESCRAEKGVVAFPR